VAVTPRRIVLGGALVTTMGLALAATAPDRVSDESGLTGLQSKAGGLLVLVGWAALAWGTHRFGRAVED
jgi:hypothetical protein